MKDISNHTGEYLHNLHKKQPSKDTLKKFIKASPQSLSYKDEDDYLPILTTALCNTSVYKKKYIYILIFCVIILFIG